MEKISASAVKNSFKDIIDFVLRIYWAGDEDKPFYKAMLMSKSYSSHVIDKEPFWNYALINTEEFQNLLAVFEESGLAFRVSTFEGRTQQYIMELEATGKVLHCVLGCSLRTLEVLQKIERGLRPKNRNPIKQIIERAKALFEMNDKDEELGVLQQEKSPNT